VGRLNDKVRHGWSRPSRIQIAWKRRAARKAESQIRTFHFPDHLEPTCAVTSRSSVPRAGIWSISPSAGTSRGSEEEAVLWDLDRRLDIERPYGIGSADLTAIRQAIPREVDGWLAGYGGAQVAGVEFAMVAPGTLGRWTSGGGAGCGSGCGGGGS
jgi:hypothetical protein